MDSESWDFIISCRRQAAGARQLAASFSHFRTIQDLLGFANALEADARQAEERCEIGGIERTRKAGQA